MDKKIYFRNNSLLNISRLAVKYQKNFDVCKQVSSNCLVLTNYKECLPNRAPYSSTKPCYTIEIDEILSHSNKQEFIFNKINDSPYKYDKVKLYTDPYGIRRIIFYCS